MQSIPSIEFKTEYGPVKVLFWGKDGIGIRSIIPLNVNRVETVVDAHLLEYDGEYQLRKHKDGSEHFTSLTIRRHDNFQLVSRSAIDKVRTMVLQLAKTLVQQKPDLFRKGEEVRLKNALGTNLANQATLQRELDELQAERHAIQLAFDKLGQEPVVDDYLCIECDVELSVAEYVSGDGVCINCVSETYE